MSALSLALRIALGQLTYTAATGNYLVDTGMAKSATSPRYDMRCVNCTELCAWSDHQPGCNGKYATSAGMSRYSWVDDPDKYPERLVHPEGSYACFACRSCRQSLVGLQPIGGSGSSFMVLNGVGTTWETYTGTFQGGQTGCGIPTDSSYRYGLACDANTRTFADWRNTHDCRGYVDTSYNHGPNRDYSYECDHMAQGTGGTRTGGLATKRNKPTSCYGDVIDHPFGWNPQGLCHVLQGRTLLSTQESCGGTNRKSSSCAGMCSNTRVQDIGNMCAGETRGVCEALIPKTELRLGPDSDQSEEEQADVCGKYAVNTGARIHFCVLFYPWWDNYRAHCGTVFNAFKTYYKTGVQNGRDLATMNPPIKDDA